MKILCVCQRGNSRSVGMAFALKEIYNTEAIACGIDAVSSDTWKLLYDWADLVVVMHDELLPYIPAETQDKIKLCNVGEDIYWRGVDLNLLDQCRNFIKNELKINNEGMFTNGT